MRKVIPMYLNPTVSSCSATNIQLVESATQLHTSSVRELAYLTCFNAYTSQQATVPAKEVEGTVFVMKKYQRRTPERGEGCGVERSIIDECGEKKSQRRVRKERQRR